MINWLASYPKSGNTWVRLFLSSLIYSEDGQSNFKSLENIMQYPHRAFFNKFNCDFNDIYSISEYWIPSQIRLNQDKKIKFLKTHHIMCSVRNKAFTNYENTKGVIYIVRDPRNVVTSVLKHFSKKDINEAYNFIIDEYKILGGDLKDQNKIVKNDNGLYNLISSWSQHYNSWKNFKKNFLLLKYENLVTDPQKEFSKLRDYLNNVLNVTFSDKKFLKSIESNSFQNLKNLEKKNSFEEAKIDQNTGKKINFFNLGKENDYKKILDKSVREKIEKKFYSEMKELNYL